MLLADLPNRAQRTTRYFYGGESQWQVCAERGAFSQITATYVYGNYIDEVLQMQRCESTPPCTSPGGTGVSPVDYYYHTDDLYNVMAVTDDEGNVVERYEYDDYGTPMVMASDGTVFASSTIGNPYLFTGRRHDPETAWYHYRTRYLDPAAGRFTTRDTIGIWGDPWEFGNGYSYVGNGPLSWLDAFGLDRWIVNDGYPHQALVYGNDKIGYWKIEIGMFVPSFGAWWHWPKDIVEVIIRGAGAVTVGTEGEVTKTGTSRPDCPPDNYSSPEEDQKLHDDVQDRSRVYYHLLWRNSNQYPDEKLKHGLGEPGPRQEPSFQDASGLWISGRIIPQRGAQVSGRMDSK